MRSFHSEPNDIGALPTGPAWVAGPFSVPAVQEPLVVAAKDFHDAIAEQNHIMETQPPIWSIGASAAMVQQATPKALQINELSTETRSQQATLIDAKDARIAELEGAVLGWEEGDFLQEERIATAQARIRQLEDLIVAQYSAQTIEAFVAGRNAISDEYVRIIASRKGAE